MGYSVISSHRWGGVAGREQGWGLVGADHPGSEESPEITVTKPKQTMRRPSRLF